MAPDHVPGVDESASSSGTESRSSKDSDNSSGISTSSNSSSSSSSDASSHPGSEASFDGTVFKTSPSSVHVHWFADAQEVWQVADSASEDKVKVKYLGSAKWVGGLGHVKLECALHKRCGDDMGSAMVCVHHVV